MKNHGRRLTLVVGVCCDIERKTGIQVINPVGVSNELRFKLWIKIQWIEEKFRVRLDRVQVKSIHGCRGLRDKKPPATWEEVRKRRARTVNIQVPIINKARTQTSLQFRIQHILSHSPLPRPLFQLFNTVARRAFLKREKSMVHLKSADDSEPELARFRDGMECSTSL